MSMSMQPNRLESASLCDRCGEIVTDIDAGFSPGLHRMVHGACGGTWRPVWWDPDTGEAEDRD